MYHSSFPLEIQLHYGNAEQQRKEEPKCHNHHGDHPKEAVVEAEVVPDKICHGGVGNTVKERSIDVITILRHYHPVQAPCDRAEPVIPSPPDRNFLNVVLKQHRLR